MLGDGLTDSPVGDIDAVMLVQGLENVVPALERIEVQAVVVGLHRNLHVLEEEVFLAAAHGLEQLHVLDGTVHHRAAVGGNETVGEVVAALDRALEQGAAVLAQKARHIK